MSTLHEATLFTAYLFPEEHLNICGEVQYIINFPVTNVKNESNCFVLKNYPLPNNEFERKTAKSLKLGLDWYASVEFCPRVNVHHL